MFFSKNSRICLRKSKGLSMDAAFDFSAPTRRRKYVSFSSPAMPSVALVKIAALPLEKKICSSFGARSIGALCSDMARLSPPDRSHQ